MCKGVKPHNAISKRADLIRGYLNYVRRCIIVHKSVLIRLDIEVNLLGFIRALFFYFPFAKESP
jgi:hypothetical protein